MHKKFRHAILGGTFDKLHAGHKAFINEAAKESLKMTIGLTTDGMLNEKQNSEQIEDFNTRLSALKKYLDSNDLSSITTIYPLTDIAGPGGQNPGIDAIFATDETRQNAQKISDERIKNGLRELTIIIVEQLMADDSLAISSSRIRNGEIDRDGKSYINLLRKYHSYTLPDELRDTLKIPFGEILAEDGFEKMNTKFIITVGDIATFKALTAGIKPILSIFDLKTNRKEIVDREIINTLPEDYNQIQNQPGTLGVEAIESIHKQLDIFNNKREKGAIRVIGEEDLLTIPCVLLAPLGAYVIYGLTGVGGIRILVTEEKKEEFAKILSQLNYE